MLKFRRLCLFICLFSANSAFAGKRIAIFQIVEHKALDMVREGALATLAKQGYDAKNSEIYYVNAHGNLNNAAQMAQQIRSKKWDVVLAISTSAAQLIMQNNRSTPVVFAPITDPVGAKLVRSNEKPEGLATGVSDSVDIKNHFSMMQSFKSGSLRVAMIYNPGENNSKTILSQAQIAAKDLSIELVLKPISDAASAAFATKNLKNIDFVYIPIDNTAATNIPTIVMNANQQKIAVFGADLASIEQGATIACGVDYMQLGNLAGEKMVKVLTGTSPKDMPVDFTKDLRVQVNQEALTTLGLKLSESIKKMMDKDQFSPDKIKKR